MIEDRLTEDQKREEIVSDIKSNIFVEAGAGAGKTTLIIDRIVNQLMDGIEPKEIAVITMTNAATEEIRGRIANRLKKEADNKKHPEDTKTKMQSALDNIESMQISTIHSLCYRMLTEWAFDAEIRLDMEIEDNTAYDERKINVFNQHFNSYDATSLKEIKKITDIAAINEYNKEYGDIATIYKIYESICDMSESTKIM